MRGMALIVAIVSLLTISAGVIVTIAQREPAAPTHTPGADVSSPSGDATVDADASEPRSTPWAATSTPGTTDIQRPTPEPGVTHTPTVPLANLPPLPVVAQPGFESLTVGLARVEAYYSEENVRGRFNVRWRPGAFPPERADTIAALAEEALRRVNDLLGANDYEPIDIFLADRMFAEECWGCQGFAASDLRQVFILADGSVAEDEYATLLIHEIGHVIAGLHIALPHSLFFAEGLAVWISDESIREAGYISPLQTAAWAHHIGILPSLSQLRVATYEGRVRARVEYDGAASFTHFVIDTYGFEAYTELYALDPPSLVLGKEWETLEAEWHAYLDDWGANTLDGVSAHDWWQAAEVVASGFRRMYDDPDSVSVDQYAALAQARLELNRGRVNTTVALMQLSGLAPGVAN
ncbi:MAG TPA: hypothetical protein VMM78_05995 [Thermomicrobiales bacterium]|nr:hypothetical protein [Thermomicrobiales bacterium]